MENQNKAVFDLLLKIYKRLDNSDIERKTFELEINKRITQLENNAAHQNIRENKLVQFEQSEETTPKILYSSSNEGNNTGSNCGHYDKQRSSSDLASVAQDSLTKKPGVKPSVSTVTPSCELMSEPVTIKSPDSEENFLAQVRAEMQGLEGQKERKSPLTKAASFSSPDRVKKRLEVRANSYPLPKGEFMKLFLKINYSLY